MLHGYVQSETIHKTTQTLFGSQQKHAKAENLARLSSQFVVAHVIEKVVIGMEDIEIRGKRKMYFGCLALIQINQLHRRMQKSYVSLFIFRTVLSSLDKLAAVG